MDLGNLIVATTVMPVTCPNPASFQPSILQEGWAGNEAGLGLVSLPGSPERELYVHGEAGIFFSCDHDVIEIGPGFLEQKGNVLRIVQQTMHSTLGVYIIRPPIARYV